MSYQGGQKYHLFPSYLSKSEAPSLRIGSSMPSLFVAEESSSRQSSLNIHQQYFPTQAAPLHLRKKEEGMRFLPSPTHSLDDHCVVQFPSYCTWGLPSPASLTTNLIPACTCLIDNSTPPSRQIRNVDRNASQIGSAIRIRSEVYLTMGGIPRRSIEVCLTKSIYLITSGQILLVPT